MCVHSGVPGSDLGWIGVDLFFVMSGFLITALLAAEYQRSGTIQLGKFWGRRLLRLMPAYWLYIGSATLAMVVGIGWLHSHDGWTPAIMITSLWAYLFNYLPQGGLWKYQSLLIHLWSLSVEEQYYFLWPGLCLLAMRAGRAELLAWGIVALCFVCRSFASASVLKVHLETRGLGLFVGAAVAISLANGRFPKFTRMLGRPLARLTMVLLIISILVCATILERRFGIDTARYLVPTMVTAFALLIASLWSGPLGTLPRVLSWPPIVYIGRISYGLYLYHMFAQVLVWQVLTPGLEHWPRHLKFAIRLALFFGLTLAMAAASYQYLERPFLRLKRNFR